VISLPNELLVEYFPIFFIRSWKVREADSFNDFGLVSPVCISYYFCFGRLAQLGSGFARSSGSPGFGAPASLAQCQWHSRIEAVGPLVLVPLSFFLAAPCCAIFLAYFAALTPLTCRGRPSIFRGQLSQPGQWQWPRQSIICQRPCVCNAFQWATAHSPSPNDE